MSHEDQTDLRIRRTHKFLQEAMVELITEKGFDAITVGDIAERAMINRATFYRHYQDKYDLVARIFEETANQLVENMKPIRKDTEQGEMEYPPEIWIQFFEHVAEHARLYRAMLGKNGSSWFAARMREHTIKLMSEIEKQWEYQLESRQQIEPAIPQELPVTQLSHILIGTIVWWLESEKSYTPRHIASWFHRFAFYGYLSALGYKASTPGSVPLRGS
ncbi:MAG: TetR/AcrR family transcriptional regulator [Ktedonobacteraceae bacterium]|nr:TetR/AcrR family transcriptional regulator [Ktedonobacteraceae bacterium]